MLGLNKWANMWPVTGVCEYAFFKFGMLSALGFDTKLMVPKRSGNKEK
jgi:hypothetical protein